MAKVLFIQANYDLSHPHYLAPWMPLALVELATFIREKGGHEVKILDRNLNPDDSYFINMLKNFNPDFIGMTCYTSLVIKDVKHVSKIVKKNSSAKVIIGGVHATLEPKSLLDFPYIDLVVRGEGEETLLEICNIFDKKGFNIKTIQKLSNVNYNFLKPFLDLNTIPIPDYSLLSVKKYPVATFYSSRGCPGKCKFCYNQGRQLRYYNTKNFIETLSNVLDKYNIREFTIADDNFANISKRSEEICNFLSKYNSIFHIFLRVDMTQEKVMKNLKKAGCWSIQFGFESGNQRILDFIGKGVSVQQNIEAIKKCKKNNIFVDGSFMVGLPTETISEVKDTANFIKKYKPDAVDVKIFKPYPSTELYNFSVENKLMIPPKTLEEWESFCELKQGEPNVSNTPKEFLVKTVNDFSKTSYLTYLKKTALLLKGGHINYTLFKTKYILKRKLGLEIDNQKTKK
jgi:anaerobic magnesium-protoporphyrin IX monomethyl ester cyclase